VLVSSLGTFASGCVSLRRTEDAASSSATRCAAGETKDEFDYVVIGSGAGGGPLAANLARAGFRVLLLEAGGDEPSLEYDVPAFHARASEDERYAWNFFVRHYTDDDQQERDPKYCRDRDGVLYPRCSTLGGCTAHNAMILMYPHDQDWDRIAEATGDSSWRNESMRGYFERLERCRHPVDDARGHGFAGWLATSVPDPLLLARDPLAQRLLFQAVTISAGALQGWLDRLVKRLRKGIDPNSRRFAEENGEGVCMMPMTMDEGKRVGSREYVRHVQKSCGDRLVVLTHALATRVLLDASKRATGVEYLQGQHLYGADPGFRREGDAPARIANATREVIVCAGAFNTPQLLKLSGIGPRQELSCLRIPVAVDLPGVGENLQDRYEVSVVARTRQEFSLMQGMTLRPPARGEEDDPPLREWRRAKGPYTTNGSVVSLVKRSTPDVPQPDLFLFLLLGWFRGYFPGYSQDIAAHKDRFTWAILKGHSQNAQGHVMLRSKDPRDTPAINFRYFEGAGADEDLDAVVEGIETVRKINDGCRDIVEEEILPGPRFRTRDELRQYVRDHAWGHHACGTCKMGLATDRMAVVDSRFAVHGTRNLRVVDASIFPKIPGFFIACAVYMISEKAFDTIVADAAGS
jgi:choline dehydrogenase